MEKSKNIDITCLWQNDCQTNGPHTFPRDGQTDKGTIGHFQLYRNIATKKEIKERIDQSKLNFQN